MLGLTVCEPYHPFAVANAIGSGDDLAQPLGEFSPERIDVDLRPFELCDPQDRSGLRGRY
jgi:hypothetical protein